jgi:[ribosomal protein S5]-alanine N-acetyltransferase
MDLKTLFTPFPVLVTPRLILRTLRLSDLDDLYPHPINRRVEVGYTIARAYWGQGYATEAVKELIKFGFDKMQLVRMEAVVLPENRASVRVLQKAGMKFEGVLHSYQVWREIPRDLLMYAVVNTI